jgi:flagellar protein FlbB
MYNDAGYTKVRAAPRVLGLLLLVVLLAAGGALWFDFLGIIDVTSLFAPALQWVGLEPREEPVTLDEDPLLLDSERLAKREEALAERSEELTQLETTLAEREAELQALQEQLAEREAAIADRENSVNQALARVENERAALVKLSQYFTGMPPADAVAIMVNMEDQVLLDVLLTTDELAEAAGGQSLVPFWLSLLPPERAATIGEKLEMLPEIEGAD